MFVSIRRSPERWLLAAAACAVLGWLSFVAAPGKAAQASAKTVWQYREMEVPPSAIQATLDDLGRDGWEVFDVYGASSVKDAGGTAKLVPHTFYVFAKRPL